MAQQTTNSLRSILGVDLEAPSGSPTGATSISPSARLAARIRLHGPADHGGLRRGAGQLVHRLWCDAAARRPVVGFQANTAVADTTSVYLRYDGEIGKGNDNHALMAGLRLSW